MTKAQTRAAHCRAAITNALGFYTLALLILIQQGPDGPLVDGWHGLGLAALASLAMAALNGVKAARMIVGEA